MTCHDVEMAIIQGGDAVSGDAASHLERCPACREFAEGQRMLLEEMPLRSPSEALDRRVLNAAHRHLDRQPRSRVFVFPNLVLGVAAALVFVALTAALLLRIPEPGTSVVTRAPAEETIELSPWTAAVIDMDAMDSEVDAALAELSGAGSAADERDGALEDSWDSLLEREIDSYFEAESTRADG